MSALNGYRWMVEQPSPTFLAWQTIARLEERYPGAIDPAWRTFKRFIADMGMRPVGAHLQRVNYRLPFGPANCRWCVGERSTDGRLLAEVSRFLRATGMAASTFGRRASGDPRLVRDIRNGRTLRTKSEERLRAWMAGQLRTMDCQCHDSDRKAWRA